MSKSVLKIVAMVFAMVMMLVMFASCNQQGEQGPVGPQGEQGIQGEQGVNGVNGADGKSAYELAVDKGYRGTLEEWLASLVGEVGASGQAGANGQSAYEIAVKNGYTGTETEWLTSLVGASGLNGSNGTNGKSAYELAVKNGYEGDLQSWLASLVGAKGADGKNGADGKTPYIKDGYWWIGETNTHVKAEGTNGNNGESGTDGVSVVNAYVDENLHLWIVLSNETKIDAGYVGVTTTDPTPAIYTVTFVDYNGVELKKETVERGKSATAPVDPIRSGYRFIGWDIAFNNVTSNITVMAQYEKNITSPTVVVEDAIVNINDGMVDVVISIANNPGISSLKFDVSYDSALILNNVVFDSDFGTYVTAPTPYGNPQKITCISPFSEIAENGTFATLTFKISDMAIPGTVANISLTLYTDEIYDGDFKTVKFETINGIVTIVSNL